MNAVVFGATLSANELYEEIKKKYSIIAYCDNDKNKWGNVIGNTIIVEPSRIMEMKWDEVIIVSLSAMECIRNQLLEMGVPGYKINTTYVESKVNVRRQFVQDLASVVYDIGIPGCVAEAGVFQGEYATLINECFPDRELYLFDTFEGFDQRDIKYEEANQFSNATDGNLNMTSVTLVLSRMKYPDRCHIKQGYFPDTACGINEEFCYVNLDMDLYKPTLEGLRFFYPKMVQGGIITIHDYFSKGYEGINAAIREFMDEINYKIVPFPIGDHISIAIQKR